MKPVKCVELLLLVRIVASYKQLRQFKANLSLNRAAKKNNFHSINTQI